MNTLNTEKKQCELYFWKKRLADVARAGVIINVDAGAPRVGEEASFPRIRYNEEYNWIFSAFNLSENKSLASVKRGNLMLHRQDEQH